jgi:uncharacterized protein (TIGR02302 family)
MTGQPAASPPPLATALAFERKVIATRRALWVEQVWLRLWLLFAVLGLFLAISFAGVWPRLGTTIHIGLFGTMALAAIAALVYALIAPRPTREVALRRLERGSGLPHRPATAYEDTLTMRADDPATRAIWTAHRQRLDAMIARLRPSGPRPATHRFDPYALRTLGIMGLVLSAGLLGDAANDRVMAAFRFGPPALASDARLDAWATPPIYTGRAPVLVADGLRPGVSLAPAEGKPFELPERSVLIVRATGTGGGTLSVTFKPDAATDSPPAGRSPTPAPAVEHLQSEPVKGMEGVAELKTELRRSGTMIVPGQPKPWVFKIIPDQTPKISLLKAPEPSQRGALRLNYKVEDDYGVVAAEARFAKLPELAGEERTAWARRDVLKGPRPPLDRAPRYPLRLPMPGTTSTAKAGEAMTFLELAAHPWAGLRVAMTLEAKDAAGQIGRTEPLEMRLPARRFTKPIARAIVEQRRKLVADARWRPEVVKGLAALQIEPAGYLDSSAYLGLRTAMARLQNDRSRAGMRSVIDQLWHVALRIEDGSLSDAERRLKDAQDKLSKALEDGASEEELQKLMQELRQAMNDYVEQLAKQAQENQDGQEPGDNETQLGQNDLERMMRQMEQAAKSGARDQAQQMLSEMRDMMDRLQARRATEAERQQSREMQKNMDELGNVIGQQQKLQDDTFGQMKREADRGRDGQQRQQGRQGERGQPGQQQGQQGQQSDRGRGQRQERGQGQGQQRGQGQQGGQPGEAGQAGEAGQQQGQAGLRDRQKRLSEQLDRLKRDLQSRGAAGNKEIDGAAEAMENAERSLERGALDDATDHQAEALDKMRQGAQQMQQEMARNGRQRYGDSGDAPRDPLGRPQRAQGPDAGTSVKVPKEIEMQRAREILEELRRRSAEQTRPPVELDYLDRLLKRF